MPTYRLSRAAAADLARIAAYTVDNFGIDQAMAYRDGLMEAFALLAKFPHMARERSELRGKSRVHPYQSHLIFYRLDGSGIFIQRVRHGREDWAAQVGRSPGS